MENREAVQDRKDLLTDLDAVIERTGASYGEAYEALRKQDNDVLRAIIAIEKDRRPRNYFGIYQMVEKTKDMKIRIIKEEKRIGEIPAVAGILGIAATCFLPRFSIVGAVGSVAALLSDVNLKIVSSGQDGERQEANRKTGKTVGLNHEFVMELADLAEQNTGAGCH